MVKAIGVSTMINQKLFLDEAAITMHLANGFAEILSNTCYFGLNIQNAVELWERRNNY